MAEFYLYTDGASKGNPGRSGAGALLFDKNHIEIFNDYKFLGTKTNNEAEYEALLLGIQLCLKHGIDTTIVNLRADSELMIKQLLRVYRVKHVNLIPLFAQVKDVKFKSIEHVYREKNTRADQLANLSLSLS